MDSPEASESEFLPSCQSTVASCRDGAVGDDTERRAQGQHLWAGNAASAWNLLLASGKSCVLSASVSSSVKPYVLSA